MSADKIRDQKEAITQFIQHVENLESYGESGFDQEYSLVQEAQFNHQKDELSLMNSGKLESNLKKNRYKDIVPYDEHRVVLETPEDEGSSDYINASWIQGELGTGRYIASQGPLPGTVNDFWKMVWQNQVEIIFMVCRLVEQNKIKCSQYWGDVGTSQEYGGLMVYTESEESIVNECTLRKLRVSSGVEVHHVTQFHYWGWPDHGIPENPHDIQDIIEIMRTTRGTSHSHVVVHCSAGCGRTGAIITIDYVWTLLEEGKFGDNFSLFDLICDLRKQRMSLVQTPDQYALVNKVVKCLCEERLLKLTSHTYENVDFRQEVPVIGNGHKRDASADQGTTAPSGISSKTEKQQQQVQSSLTGQSQKQPLSSKEQKSLKKSTAPALKAPKAALLVSTSKPPKQASSSAPPSQAVKQVHESNSKIRGWARKWSIIKHKSSSLSKLNPQDTGPPSDRNSKTLANVSPSDQNVSSLASVQPSDQSVSHLATVPPSVQTVQTLTTLTPSEIKVNKLTTTPVTDQNSIHLTTVPASGKKTPTLATLQTSDKKGKTLTTQPPADRRVQTLASVPSSDKRVPTLATVQSSDRRGQTLSTMPSADRTIHNRATLPSGARVQLRENPGRSTVEQSRSRSLIVHTVPAASGSRNSYAGHPRVAVQQPYAGHPRVADQQPYAGHPRVADQQPYYPGHSHRVTALSSAGNPYKGFVQLNAEKRKPKSGGQSSMYL